MALYRVLVASLLFHTLGTSIPVDGLSRDLRVVKRTTSDDGTQIDWVALDSQTPNGKIAGAPPIPKTKSLFASDEKTLRPKALLQQDGAEKGPEGTVPIFVANNATKEMQRTKNPPVGPELVSGFGKRAVGDHWYASSAQTVNNHGGQASYSLFKAYTQASSDFSLLQVAVANYDVPNKGMQTVEAGWINYPAQIASPHLFTFFTTDGYSSNADNTGGWNRDVGGWVQVDTEIFPGTPFGPFSTRGGTQYDMEIQYWLYEGNWWLFVLDRWIGYYPASLFGAGTTASQSLQTFSDHIHYYGEIYDSHAQLTTTDMGSGSFPEAGFGQSAYIRNMFYIDTGDVLQTYDGSAGTVVSDTNRYRMVADYHSSTNFQSYMFLGGPGAGGVVDG
ncbi:DUF239-domain-containing protein [Polyplosphaeria fusca]|uniref:DUF239-domain-containing protein n=1 Tax=Polyplosphaeria fusca TaxID=682080 RepID=A0A9P4R792_9PLEO|nr:DUF239-domain-containing protein [Polyplosphaeria fusca]